MSTPPLANPLAIRPSKEMREYLRAELPGQKSAHIAEALAFSMGFGTHAALLACAHQAWMRTGELPKFGITAERSGLLEVVPPGDAAERFADRLASLSGRRCPTAAMCLRSAIARQAPRHPGTLPPQFRAAIFWAFISASIQGSSFHEMLQLVRRTPGDLASEAGLTETAWYIASRLYNGEPMSMSLRGILSNFDLVFIELAEQGGPPEPERLERLCEIPIWKWETEAHARVLLTWALGAFALSGRPLVEGFGVMSALKWEDVCPLGDYLRGVSASAADRLAGGMSLAEALREHFPEREWIAVGVLPDEIPAAEVIASAPGRLMKLIRDDARRAVGPVFS